jgi:hypothetical protein
MSPLRRQPAEAAEGSKRTGHLWEHRDGPAELGDGRR